MLVCDPSSLYKCEREREGRGGRERWSRIVAAIDEPSLSSLTSHNPKERRMWWLYYALPVGIFLFLGSLLNNVYRPNTLDERCFCVDYVASLCGMGSMLSLGTQIVLTRWGGEDADLTMENGLVTTFVMLSACRYVFHHLFTWQYPNTSDAIIIASAIAYTVYAFHHPSEVDLIIHLTSLAFTVLNLTQQSYMFMFWTTKQTKHWRTTRYFFHAAKYILMLPPLVGTRYDWVHPRDYPKSYVFLWCTFFVIYWFGTLGLEDDDDDDKNGYSNTMGFSTYRPAPPQFNLLTGGYTAAIADAPPPQEKEEPVSVTPPREEVVVVVAPAPPAPPPAPKAEEAPLLVFLDE
jgi:hypothetical protein